MKHAFWDRLLIIVCALMLLAISAVLLGIVIGFVPVTLLIDKMSVLAFERTWRVILCIAAVLLAVLAVFVFWIVLPRRKGRFSTFALQQTENGALKISVKALESLVQKCISQHPELTVVSLAIYSNETTVSVELRVTLQSDINIPLAISALQKEIKQYVEACTGVDVETVLVSVESTVPPVPGTDSPYAIPETLHPAAQPQLPKLMDYGQAPAPQAAPAMPVAPHTMPIAFVKPAEPDPQELPQDIPEDEDTSWMEAKPVELGEGPGLSSAHQPPEPMPNWLLEREPGGNAHTDDDAADDANEETARGDAQEGE